MNCAVKGCVRGSEVRGLCAAHYRIIQYRVNSLGQSMLDVDDKRLRGYIKGITKSPNGRKPKCAVACCDREISSRQLCIMHYCRARCRSIRIGQSINDMTDGQLERRARYDIFPINNFHRGPGYRHKRAVCAVPHCGKIPTGRGLCHLHYQRAIHRTRAMGISVADEPDSRLHLRARYTVEVDPHRGLRDHDSLATECAVANCGEDPKGRGLCNKHYALAYHYARRSGAHVPSMTNEEFLKYAKGIPHAVRGAGVQ